MRAPLIAAAVLSSLVATAAAGGEVRIRRIKVASGPRPAKAIKRAFAAVRATLVPCIDPMTFEAKEVVWVAIGADGIAATLAPDGTTRFGACVATAIATMRLPPAAAPTAVRVDLTFLSETQLESERFADALTVEGPTDVSEDLSRRAPGASLDDQLRSATGAETRPPVTEPRTGTGGGPGVGTGGGTRAGGP
jgi:hypothetical protein